MSALTADQAVSIVFGDSDDAIRAVDHVFAVCEATYGPAWIRALGTAPIGTIKTVWAYQLGQFTHSKKAKHAIMWALRNLPDSPPSPIQFRNLCRSAPSVEVLALPAPATNPAIVKAIVSGLKASTPSNPNGMKDWAHRLRAKEAAGYKLSRYQKLCVNEAIGEAV